MAIKIGGTTVIDDSRNLTNINSGAIIGIRTTGGPIGVGATTLNFVGSGNTFFYDESTRTLDISIAGGGGGAIGVSSRGTRIAVGITDINIAIGSTWRGASSVTAVGTTATISADLGDYYIFRRPLVGFATMKVLVAGSQGGIAYTDFIGGSVYTGLSTVNTDQFPWVAGIGITINPYGHLIFTVP
jgi:hypothetical protein